MQSLAEPTHICTIEELQQWMTNNLNLHLEVQTHSGMKNLVATFTPFPIKYYNYIKRYYKYNKNKRGTKRSIDTTNSIYLQIHRGVTSKYLNNQDLGVLRPWLCDNSPTAYFQDISEYADAIDSNCSFGKYIQVNNRHKLIHKFTYHLSPTDARKGYKVLLNNIDKVGSTLYYGYQQTSNKSRPFLNLIKYPIYIVMYCGIGEGYITCATTDTIHKYTDI